MSLSTLKIAEHYEMLARSQWTKPNPNISGRMWCTRNDRFICVQLSWYAYVHTGERFPYELIDLMVDFCAEPLSDLRKTGLTKMLESVFMNEILIYFPTFHQHRNGRGGIDKIIRWRHGYISRVEFFQIVTPSLPFEPWENMIVGNQWAHDKSIRQVTYFYGKTWFDATSTEAPYIVVEDQKLSLRIPRVPQEQIIFFVHRRPFVLGKPI